MVRGGNKERYRMRTIIEKGREGYGFFFFFKNRIDDSNWNS